MAESKNKIDINPVTVVGGIVAVWVLSKISGAFSFFSGWGKESAQTEGDLLLIPEFQADYMGKLAGQKVKFMKQAEAEAKAKGLHDAKGFFNDDEVRVYGIIASIKYKTQLAQVAQVFSKKYDKNLGAFLAGFLNSKERQHILDYIKKMGTGIV